MIAKRQPVGWPSRPVRAAGSRSGKKPHHTDSISSHPHDARVPACESGFQQVYAVNTTWLNSISNR